MHVLMKLVVNSVLNVQISFISNDPTLCITCF